MQIFTAGFCYVGGAVLISLLGMWAVRQLIPGKTLEDHKEIAGFIYAVIGGIYGVVLGFAVVALWDDFNDAQDRADQEASRISDLHRLAQGLPKEETRAFRMSLQSYCKSVIDEEWDAMEMKRSSSRTHDRLLAIWQAGHRLTPRTDTEKIIFDKIEAGMASLDDARRGRLLAARTGLPAPLKFALFAGAGITIGFSLLFGVKSAIAQSVMTILLAALIGLGLFLIMTLEGPFSGGLKVQPEAFASVLENWDRTPEALPGD